MCKRLLTVSTTKEFNNLYKLYMLTYYSLKIGRFYYYKKIN